MASTFLQKNHRSAVFFALQGTPGVFDPGLADIADGTTVPPHTLGDGLLRGMYDTGIQGSGVEFSYKPIRSMQGPRLRGIGRSGPRPSAFSHLEVVTFTVTVPVCGNRVDTTATPVALDFKQEEGLHALYRCAGFNNSSGAVDHQYEYNHFEDGGTVEAKFASALFWDVDKVWAIRDVLADVTFSFVAGSIPTAQFTCVGVIDEVESINSSIPALNYGVQEEIHIPAWTENARFQYDALTTLRDVTGVDISISNDLQLKTNKSCGRTVAPGPATSVTFSIAGALLDIASYDDRAVMERDLQASGALLQFFHLEPSRVYTEVTPGATPSVGSEWTLQQLELDPVADADVSMLAAQTISGRAVASDATDPLVIRFY